MLCIFRYRRFELYWDLIVKVFYLEIIFVFGYGFEIMFQSLVCWKYEIFMKYFRRIWLN